MRLLLDTHALLWWLFDDPALSAPARTAIASQENTVFVSGASAWEISTKWRLGRLPEAGAAVRRLPELVAEAGFHPLPIGLAHAIAAGTLEFEHRDPFDRMLIAQTVLEGLVLVTRDETISQICEQTLW